MEGKRNDWEGVVLIPFIDESRLLEASRTVGPAKLSRVCGNLLFLYFYSYTSVLMLLFLYLYSCTPSLIPLYFCSYTSILLLSFALAPALTPPDMLWVTAMVA